jgi:hypothetical protein
MARTAQSQLRTNCIRTGELRVDIGPHFHIEICFGISDEVHAMLSPAEEHVNAVLGAQKANLALFVAAN